LFIGFFGKQNAGEASFGLSYFKKKQILTLCTVASIKDL
jgi:hypothetical protein